MIGAIAFAIAAAGPVLQVPFDERWTASIQEGWSARVDHRDLLTLRHANEPGTPGTAAAYTRTVRLPETWPALVWLHFYCSDDTASGDSDFVGRRRKQVLIDGEVVWSSDLCDEPGAGRHYRVPVAVDATTPFTLTLLGYNVAREPDDLPEVPFPSKIYWGDVALASGEAEPPEQTMPSRVRVPAIHAERWPLPGFTTAMETGTVDLAVSFPDPMPSGGFPMSFGVPLPPGVVQEAHGLRFREGGRTVAVQTSAAGWWADESLQWVLCDWVAKPSTKTVRMEFTPAPAKQDLIALRETDTEMTVNGGARLTASRGRLLHNIHGGSGAIAELGLRLKIGDTLYTGAADDLLVWDRGPVRTTLLIQGRFSGGTLAPFPFHLYASAYAGAPYVKLWLRVFNDTAEPIPISALEIAFTLDPSPDELSTSAGPLKAGEILMQVAEDVCTLGGRAVEARGYEYLASKGVVVVLKHFRERFPRSYRYAGSEMVADAIAAADSPVYISSGEATSHELWIAFVDDEPAAVANAVHHPPIFHNPAYFCATGALGPAAPLPDIPNVDRLRAALTPAPTWEALGQRFGVRDFPDAPFIGCLPNWSNNYYERMLGLWSAWMMTGDRTWFEHAADTCRHLMDVAIVHSDVPGQDWRGAMHGPGPNHVAGPWSPLLRAHGLSLFHYLTGEPEAREAVHALADYCMRSGAGIHGPSPRHAAGPLDTVATTYAETGDVELLEHGSERVEALATHLDLRRGLWMSGSPDGMTVANDVSQVAQLARSLFLWYHATGDVDAAGILVALADAVVCEQLPWDDDPGTFSPSEALFVLPMLYAAHDLTGDQFFADHAQRQLSILAQSDARFSPLYGFWHSPWLAWHLRRAASSPGAERSSD